MIRLIPLSQTIWTEQGRSRSSLILIMPRLLLATVMLSMVAL